MQVSWLCHRQCHPVSIGSVIENPKKFALCHAVPSLVPAQCHASRLSLESAADGTWHSTGAQPVILKASFAAPRRFVARVSHAIGADSGMYAAASRPDLRRIPVRFPNRFPRPIASRVSRLDHPVFKSSARCSQGNRAEHFRDYPRNSHMGLKSVAVCVFAAPIGAVAALQLLAQDFGHAAAAGQSFRAEFVIDAGGQGQIQVDRLVSRVDTRPPRFHAGHYRAHGPVSARSRDPRVCVGVDDPRVARGVIAPKVGDS